MKTQKISPKHKLKTPFLNGFPAKFKPLLLKGAVLMGYPKGSHVFRDGEKANKFYLILKGKINILAEEQDVRFDQESSIGVLQTLGKGDVAGWSWVIPPYRWRFDAVAAENCDVLAIDGAAIRQLMTKNHSFAFEIYRRLVPVMNQRLVASRLKLQTFGGKLFQTAEGG